MNKRLSLIIGGVLAILAVFLVRIYLSQQREAIKSQEEQRLAQIKESQVPVLVAKLDIAPGTALEPGMFDIAIASSSQVPPQAITSYEQIIGKETLAPISKGEPMMTSKLSMVQRRMPARAAYSLSGTTPIGKRAITIPVDNISSVGGMVKPGDYVDVICLLSVPIESSDKKTTKKEVILPLLQNVLVLAVGAEFAVEEAVGPYAEDSKDKKAKQTPPPTTSAKTVTLALSPQEINLIAFVQEQGKIQLVLRSPEDAKIESIQPATWETIFKYFMPEKATKEEELFGPQGPMGEVEIYRGLKREVIPLTK